MRKSFLQNTLKSIFKSGTSALALMLLASSIIFVQCKPEKPTPVIESISPASGSIGETITITGKDFSNNPQVLFNTLTAELISGNNTSATVKVHKDLQVGAVNVFVKSDNGNTSLPKSFEVKEKEQPEPDPIEFNDFSPKTGKFGTEVTVTGKNFTKDVEVYIGDVLQEEVTLVSDTEITFKVKKGSGSGLVELKRGKEKTVNENNDSFTYEFTYTVEDKVFSDLKGTNIQAFDDGSALLAMKSGLLKLSNQGEIVDTLNGFGINSVPFGMFLAKNGTVYIADGIGAVLTTTKEGEKLDTLVRGGAIPADWVYDITGDNDGHLYVTASGIKKTIKVNIANKTTKEISTNEALLSNGIAYFNDSLIIANGNGLYKIHKNGGSIINSISNLNLVESGLDYDNLNNVYISGGDNKNLYKLNHDLNKLDEIVSASELNMDKTLDVSYSKAGYLYVVGNVVKRIKIE